MKKKILILIILMFISVNFTFAGEFDASVFTKYQLSYQTLGLRVGVSTGYQFSPIGNIFAPGFSIEGSIHPLSILSSTNIGGLGASVYGSFLLHDFKIKPFFGCDWTIASGLDNMEKTKGDIFQLITGLELIYKFIGIEYCYLLPEPSLSRYKNNDFTNDLGDHRFGVIYHFMF